MGFEIDAKIALAGPIAQMMSRPSRDDRAAQAVESHEEDFANAASAAASIALLGWSATAAGCWRINS
jgi:hypothetical protein